MMCMLMACGCTLEPIFAPSQVLDVIRQLMAAAAAPPPSSKGPRLAGGLQEGGRVQLGQGTPVTLCPASQADAEARARGGPGVLGGTLPAEIAGAVPWVLSCVDGADDGIATIANLPCRAGDQDYPMFYLCGTVPRSAIRPAAG